MKTKICSNLKCKQPKKPISEFHKDKHSKDGHKSECKICRKTLKIKEILPAGMKRCSNPECDEVKLLSEFPKGRNQCKKCIKIQQQEWRKNNPDYNKEYRKNNEEELKQYKKQWDNENPDYNKTWNEQNPDYYKTWNEQNPDYYKTWNENNPGYKKEYEKNRKINDIGYKILGNLRSMLNRVLKGKTKSAHTMELIGCSIKFLLEYLEKQFTSKMNWNNYGKNKYWEIDHIIPCSLFDLTKPEEQRKCFHYSNLQPLTIKENREKSNKLNWIK